MSPRVQWTSILAALTILSVVAGHELTNTTTAPIRCEDARLKCAYRTGCGAALQQYIISCASDLQGDGDECSQTCLLALIAVTSTDEGKQLMTCTCAKGDTMCLRSKQRVEVCRVSVLSELNKSQVTCKIATTICNADAICSTALKYYHFYCRSMMNGKKCTHRCKNSMDILSRQEKAQKLNNCICGGKEDKDCHTIHRNMKYLCFKDPDSDENNTEHDTRTNEISRLGNHYRASGFSAIAHTQLIFGIMLMLYSLQD